jgi:hypothetical protein
MLDKDSALIRLVTEIVWIIKFSCFHHSIWIHDEDNFFQRKISFLLFTVKPML